MRKISPDSVRNDFRQQIADLTSFYNTGMNGFLAKKDKSAFVENCLLVTAVAWESFVSDMFIAFVNRDATSFKTHMENSLREHLKDSGMPKRAFDAFGSLRFPTHLDKIQVQSLADSSGNNITFSTYEKLEEKAAVWLTPIHGAKFSGLTPQQKAIINGLIALRNHVAHRSQRSLDAMNDVLFKGVLHPTGLKRGANKFHNVGAWLKAKPLGSPSTRLSLLVGALDGIGATF